MIHVTDLTKDFGSVRALDKATFSVPRGSIFGLIGPNGAGKTTCLNILSTLLKPTSGTVTIDGLSIHDDIRAIRRRIGYMPDFFGTYRNISVLEYLEFYAGCCGLRGNRRDERVAVALATTHLEGKRDDLVDGLSRGMKQRLCLAKALVHEPAVLLLDEPASGLDPRARSEIRDILKDVATQDATVLISSHILSELERLCTHIGIIEQGKLLRSGSMSEILRAAHPANTWRITVTAKPENAALVLREVPSVVDVVEKDNAYVISVSAENAAATVSQDAVPPELLKAIVELELPVTAMTKEKADLEDAFLKLTEGLLA